MCSQSQMHSYRWITPIKAPQFYILSASHSLLRQLRFTHHKMTNSRLVLILSTVRAQQRFRFLAVLPHNKALLNQSRDYSCYV